MASMGLQVLPIYGADRDKLLGAGQHVERISLGMNLVMEASRYGVVWSRVIQS
jgi:hypothetical protein